MSSERELSTYLNIGKPSAFWVLYPDKNGRVTSYEQPLTFDTWNSVLTHFIDEDGNIDPYISESKFFDIYGSCQIHPDEVIADVNDFIANASYGNNPEGNPGYGGRSC